MKKAIPFLVALAVALTALPLPAQTGTWTAVASTGAIDSGSIGILGTGGASLFYYTNSLATVFARYNVTNTYGGGISDTPGWKTLELTYTDTSPFGGVSASLYQVDPCTGKTTRICQVISEDSTTTTCKTCSFDSTTFNFSTTLYYVEVTLGRSSNLANPAAIGLRIY